jgi:hypothetical protein
LKTALAVLVGLVCATGCDDEEVISEPCNWLEGDHTGTYSFAEIDGSETVVDTMEQLQVRFTCGNYNIRFLELADGNPYFCNSSGEYSLATDSILFVDTDGGPAAPCNALASPYGYFNIDDSSLRDTVVFSQVRTVESIRRIKILKLATGQASPAAHIRESPL